MARKKSAASNLTPEEQRKLPPAPQLRSLLKEPADKKDLALHIGCTVPAINQYLDGAIVPSLENLCKIADYFHVSVDFLLGRSEVQSPNQDVQAICRYTGLSDTAVEVLNDNKGDSTNPSLITRAINKLLEDEYEFETAYFGDDEHSALRYLSLYLFLRSNNLDGVQRFVSSEMDNRTISVPIKELYSEALLNIAMSSIRHLKNSIKDDETMFRYM